jgi:signal transduction histidine kinase/ligand-binding sensor domain-containing protein
MLASCSTAFALNPALDVNQYAHTAWRIRDGFFKGTIYSIAQTPDGYLWLATEVGLLRFDGVRAVPWQPPPEQQLPSSNVRSLLVTRDGALWIGTDRGLANWKAGKLTHYRELTGSHIATLIEDREGTIWTPRFASGWTLCAIRKGRVTCYGEDGGPGAGAIALYEDSKANLWVGTVGRSNGVWRWGPGSRTFYPLPQQPNGIRGLSEDAGGALLIAGPDGIRRLANGKSEITHRFASSIRPANTTRLLRDRDGGLWVGMSAGGLAHIHHGITDTFTQLDGLTGNMIAALYEDREGNIWVATSEGLDRFRDVAVASFSDYQGLSSAAVNSVLASVDGSVWLGTADGVSRWSERQVTVFRPLSAPATPGRSGRASREVRELESRNIPARDVQSIFQDRRGRVWVSTRGGVGYLEHDRFVRLNSLPGGLTRAIVEDKQGNLWMSNPDAGLFRVSAGTDRVEHMPWAKLTNKKRVNALAADPLGGGLWFGFFEGGIAYFADGQLRVSYTAADGLAGGRVSAIQPGRDGTLWVATDGGLSRLKDSRLRTLSSKNGLPCDAVGWSIEDDAHSLWLGMPCGLVRIAHDEMDAWVAANEGGNGNSRRRVQVMVFDNADGVRTYPTANYNSAPVARASDGRLWFLSQDGVSVVDPRHLPFNDRPPPVHVEQVIADRETYDTASINDAPIRLPALTRDLQIDYAALSLVAPEKNRFKIKLEGWDREWWDMGNRRQAFYNNLPPRNYRFRVLASNNSGVWNEAGAALDFSVAPAYYQTRWFQGSMAAATLGLVVGLYRLRLRRLASQFNMRLEERVNERTRVARDLHDTLLQSFQGLVLRFQAVTYLLPQGSDQARQTLESALEDAGRALVEARDAVQGLRSATTAGSDLPSLITALGEELTATQTNQDAPALSVNVEGHPRDIAPIVRDEIYRIVREALRNAFRHANASRIQVEIRYAAQTLRVRIRDDGNGVDQEVVDQGGRAGHYGLAGMRERAELIKGTLTVWSERGSGTEVELTIPASVAYAQDQIATPSRLHV